MKVRNIIHGQRDRIQRQWPQKHLRRAHRAVRKFASRTDPALVERMAITLSLMLAVARQRRKELRFNKQMRRPSYRRRIDRLLLKARTTGGRIVCDWRGSRVVSR